MRPLCAHVNFARTRNHLLRPSIYKKERKSPKLLRIPEIGVSGTVRAAWAAHGPEGSVYSNTRITKRTLWVRQQHIDWQPLSWQCFLVHGDLSPLPGAADERLWILYRKTIEGHFSDYVGALGCHWSRRGHSASACRGHRFKCESQAIVHRTSCLLLVLYSTLFCYIYTLQLLTQTSGRLKKTSCAQVGTKMCDEWDLGEKSRLSVGEMPFLPIRRNNVCYQITIGEKWKHTIIKWNSPINVQSVGEAHTTGNKCKNKNEPDPGPEHWWTKLTLWSVSFFCEMWNLITSIFRR